MTTILQSCFETQFTETTTIKLKVATPKSLEFCRNTGNYPTHEINNKVIQGGNMPSNHDLGGWSFLQVLSNVSSTPKGAMEKENVYVHPLTKQYSSSRLSEKSLELCTENLGSETGSDIMDISILSLSPSNSPPSEKSWLNQEAKLPQEVESSSKYKVNSSRKFPPPLTTISRSNSLQFRPQREDGRLVIQAVEAPLKHTYFQAERSHGRLRLSFRRGHATKFDSQVTRTEENEVDDNDDDYEVGVDYDHDFEEDCQLQEEEDDDDEENGTEMSRGMDDNIFDVGVEMELENLPRLMNRRCNEGGNGNKGLRNWPEPLCVATS